VSQQARRPLRTSALRSIGCEKSRASLSVSVCAVPQPKLEICRAAPARPGTVGQRAGGHAVPGGRSDRAGALVHLPAFERKFIERAGRRRHPPRQFSLYTQSPLQNEDRVVSHPEYHGHRATALHIRGP